MRMNNRNDMLKPNQLLFENVEVRNIFYDMNSLINMTEYGGNITLLNSTFQRISICGAIVKNYYSSLGLPNYSNL